MKPLNGMHSLLTFCVDLVLSEMQVLHRPYMYINQLKCMDVYEITV